MEHFARLQPASVVEKCRIVELNRCKKLSWFKIYIVMLYPTFEQIAARTIGVNYTKHWTKIKSPLYLLTTESLLGQINLSDTFLSPIRLKESANIPAVASLPSRPSHRTIRSVQHSLGLLPFSSLIVLITCSKKFRARARSFQWTPTPSGMW